jgi:hypothetical protein
MPPNTAPAKSVTPKDITPLTQEEFHKEIRENVGKPVKKYIKIGRGKTAKRQAVSREHGSRWASSIVNLKNKTINTRVYLDFQKNKLDISEYAKLKALAVAGIGEFWSRKLTIAGQQYTAIVNAIYRKSNSIDVDLIIHKGSDYARSHNSGIVDASFIYNQGAFPSNPGLADNNFKLTSGHEFGHSVLEYFGGAGLSWGHKGSTSALLQSVKGSTPGYPPRGEIDLMMYYNKLKNTSRVNNIYQRTIAAEQDVKRLIWMSGITFTP